MADEFSRKLSQREATYINCGRLGKAQVSRSDCCIQNQKKVRPVSFELQFSFGQSIIVTRLDEVKSEPDKTKSRTRKDDHQRKRTLWFDLHQSKPAEMSYGVFLVLIGELTQQLLNDKKEKGAIRADQRLLGENYIETLSKAIQGRGLDVSPEVVGSLIPSISKLVNRE